MKFAAAALIGTMLSMMFAAAAMTTIEGVTRQAEEYQQWR